MAQRLFIGDLDDVDFIDDVERCFGIAFSEDAFSSCRTIGDVHRVVIASLQPALGKEGFCLTQMAFYRLRRAAGQGNCRSRPDTRLDALQLGNPQQTMRALKRCGLDMTAAEWGTFASWSAIFMAVALIVMAVSLLKADDRVAAWSTLILCLSGIALSNASRRYPMGVETLGDLARHVATRNPMMLKAQGASLREVDIWSTVRLIASESSGMPLDQIEPTTLLYSEKKQKAA
jgi:hypothetical protein